MTTILKVTDLHADVFGTPILKGLNLEVKAGEVHAIMGPNGAGKSTLSNVIGGRDGYEITSGTVEYLTPSENTLTDLNELDADERACEGIFLGFQYPVEIPGVSNMAMLKAAINSIRKYRGEDEMSAGDFLKLIKQKAELVEMDQKFLKRSVNEGFSGGEKKRNEILQMAMLEPTLALLDETDSGLDIDALKIVSQGVNTLRGEDRAIVLVTHYQRLLEYVVPDFVHVLADGKIVKSGDKSLALKLEAEGYGWIDGVENLEASPAQKVG
ncbi:MAG: Fe-S cluster assembly ATPase SufC [Acidiferrobacterales bacterium]|nr:Fe-S cluster assembly ATPase SufC [Acidiferrobacterales bacterium]